MRSTALLVIALVAACTPPLLPPPRHTFVAEGSVHVIASHSATLTAANVSSWYGDVMRTQVPALRDAPGNVAVYVLRRDEGNQAVVTLMTEWKSRDDLDECRRSGVCRMFDEELQILFEAVQ